MKWATSLTVYHQPHRPSLLIKTIATMFGDYMVSLILPELRHFVCGLSYAHRASICWLVRHDSTGDSTLIFASRHQHFCPTARGAVTRSPTQVSDDNTPFSCDICQPMHIFASAAELESNALRSEFIIIGEQSESTPFRLGNRRRILLSISLIKILTASHSFLCHLTRLRRKRVGQSVFVD